MDNAAPWNPTAQPSSRQHTRQDCAEIGTGLPDAHEEDSRTAAVDRMLASARSRIGRRVRAQELLGTLAAGALVVDIRPAEQRDRDGVLPGAIVVDRNVLEWRLDPTCPYRLDAMDDRGRRVVIVCNEGYASSLAAAALRDMGLTDVTDVEGGYQALAALPNFQPSPTA
jgi:rhodanese-related sulfurtransferase